MHPAHADGEGTRAAATGTATSTADGAFGNDEARREHEERRERLEDEARKHPEKNGEPNQELMHKAHHEGRLARANAFQAREFAREALAALSNRAQQSTAGAAPATMSDGRPIDVAALQKLASQPISGEEETQTNYVGSSGFYGGAVEPGSSTSPQPQMSPAQTVVVVNPAGAATPGAAGGVVGAASSGRASSFASPSRFSGEVQTLSSPEGKSGSDLKAVSLTTDNADNPLVKNKTLEAQQALAANRKRVMQQLGLRAPASIEAADEPVHLKEEDIFNVMHTRYQSLKNNGGFYEEGAELPPTPGPSSKPPPFSRGL